MDIRCTPSRQRMRDHLFVSYATEDGALAEWLALRLTTEGYRIWIDRFQLLGGEPYPQDIDEAIKEKTFRLIHLVSRYSADKPNPVKERTLALNLGRERGEDFLIPLNVDGLSATALPWMLSDLTYIPFDKSWAQGLKQLLTKLAQLQAPRPVKDGGGIAASKFLHDDLIISESESLFSNAVPVSNVPTVIRCYRLSRHLSDLEALEASIQWPHYVLRTKALGESETRVFAFEHPSHAVQFHNLTFHQEGAWVWKDVDDVRGLDSWQVTKPLLRRTLLVACMRLGLKLSEREDYLYFPTGLVSNERIRFRSYTGKIVHNQVTGIRTFRGKDTFRYHLGFTLHPLLLPGQQLVVKLGIRLRITDLNGDILSKISALARRKSITRTWFNHEILSRQQAILTFLAQGNNTIQCGTEFPIVIDVEPITLSASLRIDEDTLPEGRPMFVPSRQDLGRRKDT